jgi:ATP-dependent protease ClpP protease subunit
MTTNKQNIELDYLAYIHNYNIDLLNREVYLHSYISESENEFGVDYRSAITFEKNIRYLNSVSMDPILVHMHLPGGDWQDCLGMYDTIKNCTCNIIILAYAKVESSSSVLFQAADLRILMPNVDTLIHYGSISLDNEHRAALSSIQWSEKECDKMIDIFTDRCIQSCIAKEKKWKRMIAKKHIMSQISQKSDWILTAEDAVSYNFADGILGSKKFPNIDYIKHYAKKM